MSASGAKRTSPEHSGLSAYDPKRTIRPNRRAVTLPACVAHFFLQFDIRIATRHDRIAMVDIQSPTSLGRSCGACALCCKLIGINELNKPQNQWCPHCLRHSGCKIYNSRPNECRTFNCDWLVNTKIGDEWQPMRSKMVLHLVVDGNMSKLVIHVDSGSPLAWQKEPYYGQIKTWAQNIEKQNGLVNIYIGKRVIVVLPNKDVDLGIFNLGDKFNFRKNLVGSLWEYEFEKVVQDLSLTIR